MKKVKFTGKLSLNKETVSKLNDSQLNSIAGGITQTDRLCNTVPCNQSRLTCGFTIAGCATAMCVTETCLSNNC